MSGEIPRKRWLTSDCKASCFLLTIHAPWFKHWCLLSAIIFMIISVETVCTYEPIHVYTG